MSVITCACAFLAVMGLVDAPRNASAQQTSNAVAFDGSRPQISDSTIQEFRKQRASLVNALIVIAGDAGRNNVDRRNAIFILSNVRDPPCLAFFMTNISLRLIAGPFFTAQAQAKKYPCAYVLSEYRDWGTAEDMERAPVPKRTDWRSAQAILYGVRDGPRTRGDLMELAVALRVILGRDLAVSALDDALKRRAPPTGDWHNNLAEIKRHLQQ